MTTNLAEERTSYTYEDYKGFPEDLHCEILDGEISVGAARAEWEGARAAVVGRL